MDAASGQLLDLFLGYFTTKEFNETITTFKVKFATSRVDMINYLKQK